MDAIMLIKTSSFEKKHTARDIKDVSQTLLLPMSGRSQLFHNLCNNYDVLKSRQISLDFFAVLRMSRKGLHELPFIHQVIRPVWLNISITQH